MPTHTRNFVFVIVTMSFFISTGWSQTYWWKAPNLKYMETMDEGTYGASPHYWSFGGPSTTDSTTDQTYLYTSDSNSKTYFCQYVVQELRDAENADQVQCRWAIDHIFGLPKGSSQFGSRVVYGNGGEEGVPFVGYPDDYTLSSNMESLLEADVSPNCDTLHFNHDGQYLYTNHYMGSENRMKLHRFQVIDSLAKDGQPFQLDTDWQNGGTFSTSLARLRNFTVKYIAGKDLIYYAEGDTLTKSCTLYVLDPDTGTESVLVENVFTSGEVQDADIVNVKLAGIQANDPHIFVQANIGGVKVYQLSSDGMSVKNDGQSLAFISIDDLNTLTNTTAFSSHCRAFEVTDDQQYAFFSSHNASANIFVINGKSTNVTNWQEN